MTQIETERLGRMKRKELSKLTYLAQEILDNPERFEESITRVENSDSNGGLSEEFRQVLAELRSFWSSLEDPRDWRAVAEKAVELDREGVRDLQSGRKKRLIGIALAWAAENKLWRIETGGQPLTDADNRTLSLLSESAAAAPGL